MLDSLVRVSRRVRWMTDYDKRRERPSGNLGLLAVTAAEARSEPTQSSPEPKSRLPVRTGPWGLKQRVAAMLLEGEISPRHYQPQGSGATACTLSPGLLFAPLCRLPGPAGHELNPLVRPSWFHPFMLLMVSRPLELSLQSSFQLSLTVLVIYRTRGCI